MALFNTTIFESENAEGKYTLIVSYVEDQCRDVAIGLSSDDREFLEYYALMLQKREKALLSYMHFPPYRIKQVQKQYAKDKQKAA